MGLILGVVGSRSRVSKEDKAIIKDWILKLTPSELTSGGCKLGADHMAEELSSELKIPIKIFLPKYPPQNSFYELYVKAYYARNRQIAEYCNILLALVRSDRGGGTENTIKHATEFGRHMILIYPDFKVEEINKTKEQPWTGF